jgi:signal transduction histidine kinase
VDSTSLIDRLAAHRTLGTVPRAELEWLVAHGTHRRFEIGTLVAKHTERMDELMVVFDGRFAIYVNRGSGPRKFMEWVGGDVAGAVPYSRMTYPPGDSAVEEAGDALVVHRDHFSEMVRECPTVTTILVHAMLDRARHFTSTDLQDDKMMSLGRLAAGLAHELNNPASAATRSAKLLGGSLDEADRASRTLGASMLTDDQRAVVDRLREACLTARPTRVDSPIERADREDAIVNWLEEHGADTAPAATLAETPVTTDGLDELAQALGGTALDAALHWIAASYTTRALATDVERATGRMHELVSAIKRFTHLDQATVAEPVDIAQGLKDTVTVHASKARAKSITVNVDVPTGLPRVRAYGGELNQVWSNLLDNALDAAPTGGEVIVRASRDGDKVAVRIIDNGSGIPSDVLSRIFDPFFTTKPVGEGTGLGLDITRRILRRHDALIDVESRPGHTEFRVALPVVAQS